MPRAVRFYGLLVVIMGGQIVSMATDRSSWPYATFAMFSYRGPAERTLQRYAIVGATADGREVPLAPCLRPLTPLQIHQGINHILQRPDREAAMHALLRDTFERCREQMHVVAAKAYEVTWKLEADVDRAPPPERMEVGSYAPPAQVSP